MLLKEFIIICCVCQSFSLDPYTVDLVTPDASKGEACGYLGCYDLKEGTKISVHIVPYSHNEMGYTSSFDGHYTGLDNYVEPSNINVKRILDYTISEMWAHEHRTFTYSDMAYFFHWWSQRDETVRRMVYALLRSGRLNFVGGGWSMSDEATTSYHAIIDHFTYTLRKINATFLDCGRPLVAWQADVLGHSREFASLMAQMGFDGLFINPISYDDELARMRRKGLEFVWRGSDDLGPDSDIYTHKLFDGYWAPPGFCFGKQCNDPLLVSSSTTFGNLNERADEFVRLMRERQSPFYNTKHVMVMMGMRDGYHDASVWFANIDKLMAAVNLRYGDINLRYSTPACFLKAVYDSRLLSGSKSGTLLYAPYGSILLSQPTMNCITVDDSDPDDFITGGEDSSFEQSRDGACAEIQRLPVPSPAGAPASATENPVVDSGRPVRAARGKMPISPQLQTKQDDFFPLAYDKFSYAVGMYSSRPAIKYIAREGHRYLQIAKQVQVMARLGNNDPFFEEYNWINGAFQDHNIISGEMRTYVMQYYVARMHAATRDIVDSVLEKGFNKLRNNTHKMQTLVMCKFNVSRCHCTNGESMFIVIYNPLPWPVTMPVRLPMHAVKQVVYDHTGKKVKAGLLELPQPVQDIPGRQSEVNMELVFIAEDLPPMGLRSYYLQRYQTGWQRPKRSPKVKKGIKRKRKHFQRDVLLFNMSALPDYEYFDDDDDISTTEATTPHFVTTTDNKDMDDETTEKTTTTEEAKITTTEAVKIITTETVKTATNTEPNEYNEINEETRRNFQDSTLVDNSTVTEELTTSKTTTDNEEEVSTTTIKEDITADSPIGSSSDDKTTDEYSQPDTRKTIATVTVTEAATKFEEVTTKKFEADKPIMRASDVTNSDPEKEDYDDDLFDYWKGYHSLKMDRRYYAIRNRYTRVNLNRDTKRAINILLANGIRISLDIQMYYYVSDDPKKMGRKGRPPGAYLFRTMDEKAEILNNYEANIYKNHVVQEVHIKFCDWASMALRLYEHSPVLEVDWLVGPIPISDGLGKEVLIKYKTNLTNSGVFYTDANGRQTVKRIRNLRPTYDHVNKDPIAGNFYPVTSKIYIEDLKQNVRFAVLNDRSQAGSSLRDGEINMLLHRRLLTQDGIDLARLNETEFGKGTMIRGQHYIYISKADHKPYKVFEKKLAKEIELKPQILSSPAWGYGVKGEGKSIWMGHRNEFSGLKAKLPLGIHILTLEQWNEGGLLLRFENYLEKTDCVRSGIKKVYLKDLFSFMEVLSVKEMTLSGHMMLKDWVPLSWKKDKFVKNFNEGYGQSKFDFIDKESRVLHEVDVNGPIVLAPQQIRTFVIQFRYINIF